MQGALPYCDNSLVTFRPVPSPQHTTIYLNPHMLSHMPHPLCPHCDALVCLQGAVCAHL